MDQFTVALSALVFTEVLSMGLRYVACSSKRSVGNLYPNISAPTTIRYIDSINGRPTYAFWMYRKSKRYPAFRFHTHSSKG
jgi:hypothetical protein